MAFERGDRGNKQGRRSQASRDVRQYSSKGGRKPLELSEAAKEYLAALAFVAMEFGAGVYIGAPATTGTVKVRVYADDDPAEMYLSPADDPAEEVGGFAEFALGAQFERAVHERVSAGRVERASEARQGANATRTTRRGAPVDPGASEGP